MNNRDVLAVDAPAPGEPLREYVDPANRAALDEQIEQRHNLIKSRLSRRERARLQRRYNRLHSRLNRARYNQLVSQRAELYQTYLMIRAAYRRRRDARLRARGVKIAAAGRDLNARLAELAPLAAEFAEIAERLRAHDMVCRLELEEKQNRAAFYAEADVWESQIRAVFRQTPRLHYIVKTDRGEQIQIPEIQRIICKPDKVYYQIRTTRQGPIDKYLGVWHSALPYGVDVKSLVCDETIDNLTAACGRIVTVERSKRSQNLFYVVHRLDSADGIPNRILYQQIVDYYPKDRHSRTPWAAGVGEDRKIIWIDFEEYPHVLIAGASGGGKSNLINQMISTLITMNSPAELRVLLIDNKGGVELSHFDGTPHALAPMVKNVDDVLPALLKIRAIMDSRFAAFLDAGARNLATFNARSSQPLPRIVVIVDEMATLLGLDKLTKDLHNELRVISSQGRAVGIHLVISTQHPTVDVLPGWVKTNMTLRIAGRMPNHTASQIIVDSVTAAALPDIPGRMVFRRGGFELLLQTPLIDDATIAQAVKLSREYPAPPPPAADQVEHIPAPKFGRDDFIAMALDQLGGKLSPARAHEILGNDIAPLATLRRLKQQITDDIERNGNTLIFRDKTYTLGRDKKAYVLIPVDDSTIEPNNETESDAEHNAADLFDNSSEDINE